MKKRFLGLFTGIIFLALILNGCGHNTVYVNYAYIINPGSNNIYGYTIHYEDGDLFPISSGPFTTGTNPSAITFVPNKFVYVANTGSNNISAYTISPETGALTEIPGSPFAAGSGPCAITVDRAYKFVYAVNWASNNISAYRVDQATGALTPIGVYATQSRPSSIGIDNLYSFVYVTNYDSNSISAYSIDETSGALISIGNPYPTGSNPCSIHVDSIGEFVYVANRSSNNVTAYSIDRNQNGSLGTLTAIPGSPYYAGPMPSSVTGCCFGKFLYVVNYDAHPSNSSNQISAYAIQNTGALNPLTSKECIEWSTSLATDPDDRFLYVSGEIQGAITCFCIDQTTGELTWNWENWTITGSGPDSFITTTECSYTSPN